MISENITSPAILHKMLLSLCLWKRVLTLCRLCYSASPFVCITDGGTKTQLHLSINVTYVKPRHELKNLFRVKLETSYPYLIFLFHLVYKIKQCDPRLIADCLCRYNIVLVLIFNQYFQFT